MTSRLLALAVVLGCACRDAHHRAASPPLGSTTMAVAPDHAAADPRALPPAPPLPPAPSGLPALPSPAHNPTTAEKVALGRLLFFDPRLARSHALACAGCHQPDHGWADPRVRSPIWDATLDGRHTPTLEGTGYANAWPWDGSMPSLEALVLGHWQGQLGADVATEVAWLARVPIYQAHFARAFAAPPSADHVAEALAAFVRTLTSGDSPWDRFEAGDRQAVSPEVIAGAQVFTAGAGCATCHPPPLYSDLGFHVRRPPGDDPGRARVTQRAADRGAFKTPSLRGAAGRGPYFHDGAVADLDAAITTELATSGVSLAGPDRLALVAFVRSLAPSERPVVAAPELPPDP